MPLWLFITNKLPQLIDSLRNNFYWNNDMFEQWYMSQLTNFSPQTLFKNCLCLLQIDSLLWMTICSSFLFAEALSRIFWSTVFAVTRRYTTTGLVCPMRWQRSWACRSAWGFWEQMINWKKNALSLASDLHLNVDSSWWPTQSLSKIMTVSAAVRLIPSPPALVLRRKMKTSGSLENLAI